MKKKTSAETCKSLWTMDSNETFTDINPGLKVGYMPIKTINYESQKILKNLFPNIHCLSIDMIAILC